MNSFPLSPRQRNQIRQSFESLGEYSDSVVLLFYGRLFEIAPNLRPLFKIDIRVQARKLMDTLSTVVAALDNFEALHDQLTDLGRKHVGYGVQPQDYDTLRKALLWALGQALGPEFDRETKAAWNELLTAISTVMLEGAAQQTGA
jgi:hemoglobin-like flavoprotein